MCSLTPGSAQGAVGDQPQQSVVGRVNDLDPVLGFLEVWGIVWMLPSHLKWGMEYLVSEIMNKLVEKHSLEEWLFRDLKVNS